MPQEVACPRSSATHRRLRHVPRRPPQHPAPGPRALRPPDRGCRLRRDAACWPRAAAGRPARRADGDRQAHLVRRRGRRRGRPGQGRDLASVASTSSSRATTGGGPPRAPSSSATSPASASRSSTSRTRSRRRAPAAAGAPPAGLPDPDGDRRSRDCVNGSTHGGRDNDSAGCGARGHAGREARDCLGCTPACGVDGLGRARGQPRGERRASPWTDEVATLDVTRGTLAEQLDLFRTTDAVLGAYYLLLHAWQSGVGKSIVAARALIAAAIGAATALMVLTANAVAGRRVPDGPGSVSCCCRWSRWPARRRVSSTGLVIGRHVVDLSALRTTTTGTRGLVALRPLDLRCQGRDPGRDRRTAPPGDRPVVPLAPEI